MVKPLCQSADRVGFKTNPHDRCVATTLVIDAYEGLYIGIFDVLGAYLHAKMLTEKQVLIKLREEFLDIMCEVNPECKEYVRYEHGQNVL